MGPDTPLHTRKMLTRRGTLSVLLPALLAACVGPDSGSDASLAGCLRIGYLDITASAPLFVAEATRLFDSVGVCVSTEIFGTSNQLVDALAADRIDYVVEVSAVPALALASRDPSRFAITAASTISPEEPFDPVVTLRTSEITTPSDLAGNRVAVFPGTTPRRCSGDSSRTRPSTLRRYGSYPLVRVTRSLL
jgi:ABC-type nitrate/sulfonate/bicarbonate transport system substrate-binding protein